MVKLTLGKIVGFNGRTLKVPKRDDNGDIVFKTEVVKLPSGESTKTAEIEEADTISLIKHIILTLHINSNIQAQVDSMQMSDIWGQLDNKQEDETLELKDETYKWLHRVLNRVVPKSKEDKELFVEQQVFSQGLFSGDAFVVKKALWKIGSTPESLTSEASI